MGEFPKITNRTIEEIQKSIEAEKKKSEELSDWENVDNINE